MRHPIRRRALCVAVLQLLAVVTFAAAPSIADAAEPQPLGFEPAPTPIDLPPAVADAIERSVQWRSIHLDTSALRRELASGTVDIELFDDAELSLGPGTVSRSVGDGSVWSATAGLDTAALTIDGDEVRGSAMFDGRSFSIVPVGAVHLIVEDGRIEADVGEPLPVPDDLSELPTGEAVALARRAIGDGRAAPAVRRAVADEDGNRIVRVLTVYSNGALSDYGDDPTEAESIIRSVIDDANVVLANSRISARLESAGIRHVDHDDASRIEDDLQALTFAADDELFDVHVERELVDADIVMMVRGVAGSTCGLAWLLQQPSSALDDEFAIGVIDTVCAPATQRGYVHEVGHILGAGHGNQPGDGVFPYSAGYNGGTYRTIMAYANGCDCDRIPFFSAPRSIEGIGPIGSTGQDNSRTLNETAHVVANFRPLPLLPIPPARLLDTRAGNQTVDGRFAGQGRLDARSVLQLQVAERGGVPGASAAVMMNVTAVLPGGPGHITVWPCDTERPTASNLNYVPGQVVPNSVLAQLGPDGRVCLYTEAPTDLLVDVSAYVPAGATLRPVVPARLLETRSGPGNQTVDDQFEGIGVRAADSTLQLQIAGRGDIPIGTDAVMLNVTAVLPQAAGHVTVWPCDRSRPTASSLNYTAGQVVPNAVLAKLDPQGRVCLYTRAATHLLVDVNGAIAPGSRILTVTPARLLETRTGPDNTTVDGLFAGTGPLAADSWKALPVVIGTPEGYAGRGGVTPGAIAAVVNVTAVLPDRQGHITVWPCTDDIPTASNLNYVPGLVIANMVVAEFGTFRDPDFDGPCIYSLGTTDLLVDVVAYF